jgi:hypothetical protein
VGFFNKNILLNIRFRCYDLIHPLLTISPTSFIALPDLNSFSKFILSNFSFSFGFTNLFFGGEDYVIQGSKNSISYKISDNNPAPLSSSYSEGSASQRFTRFNNPLINYDYKTGHYVGNWDKQYPYLINSFIEVARGIRKPSWFLSEQYVDLLKSNYSQFYTNFTGKTNLKLVGSEDWYNSHVTPLDNFFNTYYIFSKNLNFSNLR